MSELELIKFKDHPRSPDKYEIVLSKKPNKYCDDGFEYITHERRKDAPSDLYWGHYFTDLENAEKDFLKRG